MPRKTRIPIFPQSPPWKDMSELEESWARNYGFHLTEDQVTDSE